MKKSRMELREAFQKLTKENLEIALNDLELMHQTIADAIKEYKKDKNLPSKEKWNKKEKEIEDIFYDSLTKTYVNTTKSVNSIYLDKVKDFDIKDIFTLTYKKDGKTIQERIQGYLEEGWGQLKDNEDDLTVKLYLDYYLTRLLNNETKIIESSVKKNKPPVSAGIIYIDAVCTCDLDNDYTPCDCDSYGGEYPIGEDPDLPPYHPECTCSWWYEETDDPQEIEDLDLEEDT